MEAKNAQPNTLNSTTDAKATTIGVREIENDDSCLEDVLECAVCSKSLEFNSNIIVSSAVAVKVTTNSSSSASAKDTATEASASNTTKVLPVNPDGTTNRVITAALSGKRKIGENPYKSGCNNGGDEASVAQATRALMLDRVEQMKTSNDNVLIDSLILAFVTNGTLRSVTLKIFSLLIMASDALISDVCVRHRWYFC